MQSGWYFLTVEEIEAMIAAMCSYECIMKPEAEKHSFISTLSDDKKLSHYKSLEKAYKKITEPAPVIIRVK